MQWSTRSVSSFAPPSSGSFGPVVTVSVFDTEEQAVQITSSSEYGVFAAIYCRDPERHLRVARQIAHEDHVDPGLDQLDGGAAPDPLAPSSWRRPAARSNVCALASPTMNSATELRWASASGASRTLRN